MAAMKKSKSSAKKRAAKKPAAKRQQTARPSSAKNAVKRTRRADSKRDAVKSPRQQRGQKVAAPPATRLSSGTLGREPDRKPAKKAESRPNRPPATLPIPQSTFFF